MTIKTIIPAAAALLALSCVSEEFDNPLDPKGDNYLWGYEVSEEDEEEMIKDGEDGSAQLWTDPRYACDMRDPAITILDGDTASIKYGTPDDEEAFKRMMGLTDDYWNTAVLIDRGSRNTVVSVVITLSKSADPADEYMYLWNMPEQGEYYIIYEAEKPACGTVTPKAQAVRMLIVE